MSATSYIKNNQYWRDFFELYKSLPALWEYKSNAYKSKPEKQKSWEKLLSKFQEVEPDASIDTLKKKISKLKSCYRRELRKVKINRRSGAGYEYVPTLWYYDTLNFLKDQEKIVSRNEKLEFHDENNEFETVEDDEMEEFAEAMSERKRTINHQYKGEKNDSNSEQEYSYQNRKDEATIYSESWAESFRKLDYLQKIYAKKAIEEILILGQLDQLTLNSVEAPSFLR